MSHTSVPISPMELINVEQVNPLISKCQIKVCYVSDEPNRNRSVITKDVAKEMAKSLPGCPIVGYYNEAKGDFEEHNRIIDISNGEIKIKDTTKPYGFVDLNARVWFQKFLDDNSIEREYLVTEGYLWTKAFPEAQRVIEKGNNHSMELNEETLDASWVKDNNGKMKFFIINDALIEKLCILGEEVEPCFEGSTITSFSLVFEQEFKEKLFAMINEVTEFLQKGGEKVYTTYAVEIGDALWSAIYDYLYSKYPINSSESPCGSKYRIEGIYEESGQKFTILQDRKDQKYYRLNFSITEETGFAPDESLIEVNKTYVPAQTPQFSEEAVAAFEEEYNKKYTIEGNAMGTDGQEDTPKNDDTLEGESSSEEKEPEEAPTAEEPVEEPEKKYSLEDIPEYVELQSKFTALEAQLNDLQTAFNSLNEEAAALKDFKNQAERKDKQAMIDNFYMLSDEDKKDVLDNIDIYSLDDIEAKLSIICVRNKVSFSEDNENNDAPTVYNLTDTDTNDTTPAWVKAAMEVEKEIH